MAPVLRALNNYDHTFDQRKSSFFEVDTYQLGAWQYRRIGLIHRVAFNKKGDLTSARKFGIWLVENIFALVVIIFYDFAERAGLSFSNDWDSNWFEFSRHDFR